MTVRVALIEPRYYGLSYFDALAKRGYEAIAVCSDTKNPTDNGYADKIVGCVVADIRDPASIKQALQESGYVGTLSAIIPGNDFCLAITASVAADLGFTTQPPDALKRARNKDLAREAYRDAGLLCPKFRTVRTLETACATAKDFGYPLILKPTDAIASQHVTLIHNDDEMAAAMADIAGFNESFLGFRPRKEYLLEEYLHGPEFSVELVMYQGKALFSEVTEKQTGAPDHFAELSHVLPACAHKEHHRDIAETAVKGALALGLKEGSFHSEVKLTPAGPIIIETNGRPGGDHISTVLVKQAFGVDVFDALLDCYLGNEMTVTKAWKRACGIGFFAADRSGVLTTIEHWDEVAADPRVLSAELYVDVGATASPPRDSISRLGHVIVTGETPQQVKSAINELVNRVVFGYR